MPRKFALLAVLIIIAAALVHYSPTPAPAIAQGDHDVVASDLNAPRALFYDAEGTLYIVEAGSGGPTATGVIGPDGSETTSGATGRVTTIAADGTPGIFLNDLPSVGNPSGEYLGVHQIYVNEESVWLLFNGGPTYQPLFFSLIELGRPNLRIQQAVDFFSYELENNPDGNEIDSNPTDFAVGEDGTIYIIDAGGNTLYTWTAEDGLDELIVWENNEVPTGLEIGPDGNLYVTFLTAFPFAEGTAMIQVYDTDGDLETEYTGLTMAVDVKVTEDGSIYAVEFARFDLAAASEGGSPWVANSGRIVQVSAEGVTPVAEGLNFPYALLQDPDGNWLVTVNSAFSEVGSGEVWLIETE